MDPEQNSHRVEDTPKVSLLVPVYNVQDYLCECLDSAANQTLHDIEVICINDGSTDNSRSIVEGYLADPRFKVIDKPNSGYGASMNKGLDAACGKYVAILESDDFFEPDALQVLYDAAEDSGADIAKANFWFHWSKPAPRDELFNWLKASDAGVHDPRAFTNVFYRKPSIWAGMYRRSFLNDEGIRFTETPGASYQDASFNFKVWACAKRAVLVDCAVLHYRQDNEASSVNSPGKVFCVCDEYDEMVRFADARDDAPELRRILAKMRFDSYMWNYDRLAPELRLDFVRRMAEDFRVEDEAGVVDYGMFEPWKVVDRKAIVADPDAWHTEKERGAQHSKLGVLSRCFRAGGFPLVMRAIVSKVRNEGY